MPEDNQVIVSEPMFQRSDVKLSDEERARLFYWLRDHAYDSMQVAVQMKKLGVMNTHILDEIMKYLEMSREVFPLTKDKETVSILDIINGKEPWT